MLLLGTPENPRSRSVTSSSTLPLLCSDPTPLQRAGHLSDTTEKVGGQLGGRTRARTHLFGHLEPKLFELTVVSLALPALALLGLDLVRVKVVVASPSDCHKAELRMPSARGASARWPKVCTRSRDG